ncbi:hypothetical protein IG631_17000 [Alternaria alternata]|nr:hypothetical protein IG631_17000 [Alternaria alternata]
MDVARGDLCTDWPGKVQSDANEVAAGATTTPTTAVATKLTTRKVCFDSYVGCEQDFRGRSFAGTYLASWTIAVVIVSNKMGGVFCATEGKRDKKNVEMRDFPHLFEWSVFLEPFHMPRLLPFRTL